MAIQDLSNLTVMIVDPNPGMRGQIHNMLVQAGISKVEFAQNAAMAIRQLGKKSYDIILCEYDLGIDEGQDGQQLLEDLRQNKLIGLWTIFIMITSEGVYSKVVSAAELTPTDYILKPFTVDVLSARIMKAIDRRMTFLPTYQLIGQGNLREAIKSCATGMQNNPRYAADFVRLRAELHVSLEEFPEAEEMYRTILAAKGVGWAHLGFARTLIAQSRGDEAQNELERIVANNPKFMAAYDLLAKVYEANGDLPAAQRMLEEAVSISPHVVRRLRHLGDVALEAGDATVAEKSYKQVVSKARYSEFRNPEDHVNLVKALVKRGDATQATSVIRDLERSMRGSADSDVCKAISNALVQGASGKPDGIVEQLSAAVSGLKEAKGLSSNLRLSLAASCLEHKMDDAAAEAVLNVMHDPKVEITAAQAVNVFVKAGRHDLAEGISHKLKAEVATLLQTAVEKTAAGEFKLASQSLLEALHMAPGNLQVLFAATNAIIRQLMELGWDHPMAEHANLQIEQIKKLDAMHPLLNTVLDDFAAAKRKYGIST